MFCFVFSTSESDQLSFVVFFGIVSACAVIWIWPPAIQLRGAQIQGRPSKVCHAERVTEIEASPIFTGFWQWGGYGWFFSPKWCCFLLVTQNLLFWHGPVGGSTNTFSRRGRRRSPIQWPWTLGCEFLRYISFCFDILGAGGNFAVCLT